MEDCPHMVRSISTVNLRKRFNKGDKKPFCHPCQYKPFSESNEQWCCLQCGNIGCGDQDAQNGDAIQHYNTPRSDLHAIVVHVEKDSKCWCFECKAEINNRSGHVKDAIINVKRNVKYPVPLRNNKQNLVVQQALSGSTVAIPLPPPPPQILSPPADPLPSSVSSKENSKITCSRQQNKKNSSFDISDKPAGLTNLGNTCFMNSALQCLASTRLLIPKLEIFGRDQELKMLVTQVQDEALITIVNPYENERTIDDNESLARDDRGDNEVSGNRDINSDLSKPLQITLEIGPETMTGRLRQTIRGIRKFETSKYDSDTIESSTCNRDYPTSSYFNAYRPGEVHELVAKNFRRGAQHDAHELLRSIVDMMKKDQTKAFRFAVIKHFGMKKGGEGSDPSLVELVKSLDEKVRHKTFVDDVFGGELMTTQTCLTCNHVKRSHEQFLDLSLPLRVIKHEETEKKPGRKNFFSDDRNNIVIMKSLEDCLHYFTEPELLTGSNVVECENCHKINLEKIETGISPDKVFPLIASQKSSSQSSPDTERKNGRNSKKQENRKKKRASRQSKLKNQIVRKNSIAKEDVKEEGIEKEVQPGPSSSMSMVENHFHSSASGAANEVKPEEDRSKKSDGEISTQSLDDYVVIHSEFSTSGSKREIGDADHCDAGGPCAMELGEAEDEIPQLIEEAAFSTFASSKIISESLQNLSMLKLGDDGEEAAGETGILYDVDTREEYGDFDLPPAMDGIGGSASEGDEDNGVPQLDLDLPSYDKFENFHVPKSIAGDEEKDEEPLIVEKPATADEGFSEGENSMSVDNEIARRVSQGPSASSSRNSLSDSDETSKSLSNDEEQKTSLYSCIPKVTKCPCSRQQSISRPPEFLTIHFKRFQMSLGGYPTKINENVKYPMILDLTPFCFRDGTDNSFDDDGQILYALYGIVEHGGSMNWGHYVAYVKSSENDKRWFHISDSSVSVTSPNRLPSVEAYILFYERIRGEEKNRRLSVSIPSPTAPPHEPEKAHGDLDWDSIYWDSKPEDETTGKAGAVNLALSVDDNGLWDSPTVPARELEVEASSEVTRLELDEAMDSFDDDLQIPTIDEWGVNTVDLLVSGVSTAGWGEPVSSREWSLNDEKKTGMEWTTIGSRFVFASPLPSVTSSTNSFVDVCQVGLGPMDMNLTFYRHEADEEVKEEVGGAEEYEL